MPDTRVLTKPSHLEFESALMGAYQVTITIRVYLCNFFAPCAHLLESFGPLE